MKHDVNGYYLKANHSSDMPRHIMVLDTETRSSLLDYGNLLTMKIAWTARCRVAYSGRIESEEWRAWQSSFDLLDYIEGEAPRDSVLWLFGNNIFFDLQAMGFFRDFTSRSWQLEFVYDSQTTYMLVIKKERFTIKALSVTNYWSASIRELGVLLGRHKAECDFDTVSGDDLLCYCFRDTEIALDIMERFFLFIRDADLGAFRLSRAAQSYGSFRHRFMKRKIMRHDDDDVRPLEEAAYMGGRVEAYRIGELPGGPFTCFDINSMYPFIMSTYRLPTRCCDYFEGLSPSDAIDILLEHSCIAEVTIETEEPLYAWKYDGKVFFPVGRFDTFLCTEGLRQAILRGHLVAVKRLAAYEDDIVFKDYIDFFYSLRMIAKSSGDMVTDRMAKLLMNSLYGKLAQRRPIVISNKRVKADDYYRFEAFDMVTRSTFITTRLFHREIVSAGDELVPGAVCAIPAHITEYGRMMLWDIQEKVGREKVLYCDTDSIFIADTPDDALGYPVSPGKLGALSRKWTTRRLVIAGCKSYENDDSIVMKGVPREAERIAEGLWRYTYWPGQKTHLNERIDDGYLSRTVDKRVGLPYDKGSVDERGNVTPWRLPDLLASDERFLLESPP